MLKYTYLLIDPDWFKIDYKGNVRRFERHEMKKFTKATYWQGKPFSFLM